MVGLAIDVGTSLVKAAVFGPDGALHSTSGSPAPVRRPRPGWSEYDTAEVWRAVCLAVEEVTNGVQDDIDHISVTGQGDGCWLVDESGASVGPSILWNDGRAHSIVDDWTREGADSKAFRVNGSATFAGAQSAILQWLYQNEPHRLDQSAHALFCTGWLTAKLTGVTGADRSDASLPWLDISRREYSPEILSHLGLEWSERLRPALLDDASVAGTLTGDAGRSLGLRPGIPVVHAPFDSVSMAIGAGVVSRNDTLVILGTTLIVESVVDAVDTSGSPAGMTLCTGLPDTWLRLFGTLSGTDSINWMSRLLGFELATDYVREASAAPLGANGLHVLPFFSPAGERAPFIDPQARASVAGLSLDHGRADIARAHMEALTYSIRHCVDQMPTRPEELTICGGGAASDFWCQLIADVTSLPVRSIRWVELGALGADTTGHAATSGSSVREIVAERRIVGVSRDPDRDNSRRYDEMYEQYHYLRQHAAEEWHVLNAGQILR